MHHVAFFAARLIFEPLTQLYLSRLAMGSANFHLDVLNGYSRHRIISLAMRANFPLLLIIKRLAWFDVRRI